MTIDKKKEKMMEKKMGKETGKPDKSKSISTKKPFIPFGKKGKK